MDANLFASGKTWTDYLNSISKNRDRFEAVYRSFFVSEEELAAFRRASPLNIVAVAEDWCPDVYNTLGIVAKIADTVPGVNMRIFERDARPEIMANYLTEGTKKRIPVYAFYDPRFRELFWWAGRNKQADEWVNAFRNGRPYEEIPKDEMERFREEFSKRYEESFARGNLMELIDRLKSFALKAA